MVVGSGRQDKQDKHKLVIFRISYGDGSETPMDAGILVLKSPQLMGILWMIWSQVKKFSHNNRSIVSDQNSLKLILPLFLYLLVITFFL